MTTIDAGGWLRSAHGRLAPVSEQPSLEAQVLAAHVLDRPRSWVVAHPEFQLTQDQEETLEALLRRLLNREPLPYLLGHVEFYGLDFILTPAVLIPRPETELLVEHAVRWLQEHPDRRRGVDVGTGTGCIAVSLAVNVPDLEMIATDLSRQALLVARQNIAKHNAAGRVLLVQANLMQGMCGPFDLVCANLPYIPTPSLPELAVTRYEPRSALDGGPDGLALVSALLADLPGRLAPGGLALLEIEAGQRESAHAAARRAFPAARVDVLDDLSGRARLLRVENDRVHGV